jgi:GntR family transcriptional regulator
MTARSALSLLESEGLVRIAHGTGTIVTDRRVVPVALSRYSAVLEPGGRLGPWETACQQAGVNGEMVPIDVEELPAPPKVARALQVSEGSPTVRRERRATIDGHAVQLQSAWYTEALASEAGLASQAKIVGGVFGALAASGRMPATADETVSCRTSTPEEATELRLRETAAVLVIERVTRDAAGAPLEFLQVVADPARTNLVYDKLPLTR